MHKNELDNVPLNLEQVLTITEALDEYDAPEMYWGDDSSRSNTFRQEAASEIRARLRRRIERDGMYETVVTFSTEEYRITIEALTQFQSDELDPAETIKHLQWFKRSSP